jgi:hypothetical protein
MCTRGLFVFIGLVAMVLAGACDEGPRTGPGACVMHQEDPPAYVCRAVISLTHCEIEAGNVGVDDPDDWTHLFGKTCAGLGYRYCEYNGCGETSEYTCEEGGGTNMYANSLCDNDIPPSDFDCTGGVFHGIWHSKNPSGTLKAHWDFDYCRVVSWDTTGEICGFHVEIQGFEFTGVGSDQGTVVVHYGDYYNWTLCEPDAAWELDPTAPKGEQAPVNWELKVDGTINLNGEILYPPDRDIKLPPAWEGMGKAPSPEGCGTLPEVSCLGF